MTKLLTPKEAAQQLRVSISTLRGWRKKGQGLPVVELSPGTYRYSEEEIEKTGQRKSPIASPLT